MHPNSILITHVHSTQNFGDLALLEMAQSIITEAFGKVSLTILSNWPDEPYSRFLGDVHVVPSPWSLVNVARGTSYIQQIIQTVVGYRQFYHSARGRKPTSYRGWDHIIQAYQTADIVVGVSGNQFYSTGQYGWPFPLTAMQAHFPHLLSKPYYVFPQSIGPLRRIWERRMLKSVYSHARKVWLRDAVSLRLAKEIGIPPERTTYSPDPAFAYPAAPLSEAQSILVESGWDISRPTVGITVIAPQGRSLENHKVLNYYIGMAGLIKRIILDLGIQVVIFAQVTGPTRQEDDRLAIDEIFSLVGDAAAQIIRVRDIPTPSLLKACYGCMDFFVGTRLHSGIFALGMSVPALLIGYLSKTQGMMETLGLSDWVIDLENANTDELWQAFQKGWGEKEANSRKLKSMLPGIKKQVMEIADWIRQDYEKSSS